MSYKIYWGAIGLLVGLSLAGFLQPIVGWGFWIGMWLSVGSVIGVSMAYTRGKSTRLDHGPDPWFGPACAAAGVVWPIACMILMCEAALDQGKKARQEAESEKSASTG